ncbi:MAG TPA: CdaR family protein [Candidatus Limnocylindrales bacterium]|nr:CdaR family protein [Candidatus Limnocylindrales bacterium]
MSRLLRAIIYNWPLKLAAIVLATLLYAGLVVSQNAQSRDVGVQIQAVNQKANTIIIGGLGEIQQVRYFVTNNTYVTVTSASFTATVDLANIDPGPLTQSVKVNVDSPDPRIQVLSAVPAYVAVRLENVASKDVPVVVVPGAVPPGLQVFPPVPSIQRVTVRGAKSDIDRVTAARAAVPIDASGIDINREFVLTPVDNLGEVVRGVDVEPPTVNVTMRVFKDRRTATIPVKAIVTGDPGSGFEVTRVLVTPPVLTVEGDPADLANVLTADTSPVSIQGRTSDLDTDVTLALPTGVSSTDAATVHVHVAIQPITESRNFTAGVALTGARTDRAYVLPVDRVVVTVSGTQTELDAVSGTSIVVTADVTTLDVGTHTVPLKVEVPPGLTVVATSPPDVGVQVTQP